METSLDNIYSSFMDGIIDYGFLEIDEDEFNNICKSHLNNAINHINGIMKKDKNKISFNGATFSKNLNYSAINAISYWMIYEWIKPKTNNVEWFEHRLNTKEFQGYSEANHLKEMINIKNDAEEHAMYWTNQISNVLPTKDNIDGE